MSLLTSVSLGAVLAGGHLGRVGQWAAATNDPAGLRWHIFAARVAMAVTSAAAVAAAVAADLEDPGLADAVARTCRLMSVTGAITAGISSMAVGFREFGVRSPFETA